MRATSACTGVCVGLWPELTTTSSIADRLRRHRHGRAPSDRRGAQQLTLDGHPLYTFSGDTKAGQINGAGLHEPVVGGLAAPVS